MDTPHAKSINYGPVPHRAVVTASISHSGENPHFKGDALNVNADARTEPTEGDGVWAEVVPRNPDS